MIVINVEPNDLLETKHVCYFTKTDYDNNIHLFQVVENYYQHPDGPAKIPQYDTRLVQTLNQYDPAASSLVILQASQHSVKEHLTKYC